MMNNLKKVSKNYVLNLLYNIFTLIIPLVTTPYISKTLLATGVGQYSFTYSISNYFCLFAQLGIGVYGQREIAKNQGDKYKQSLLFFEIMTVKLISTVTSCFIFSFLYGINFFGKYNSLIIFWIFNIIAQFFDIAFLFQGNEDFEKVVMRNLIIKILGIAVIFLFVKSEDDVWIYVLSNSLCGLFGVLVSWTYLPRYVVFINPKDMNIIQHIKPTIMLFAPTIATSLSGYLDRTIMGIVIKGVNECGQFVSNVEIGLYEQTDKIVKLGTSVFTALGAVMLPRNSNVASGGLDKVKENIDWSLRFSLMAAIPIMFGVISISDILVPWFLGKDFLKCIEYLNWYSPMVVLLAFENVYGYQYLMAVGKDKKYTYALVIGVLIHSILDLLIVPSMLGRGAIICTIIAELIIVWLLLMYSKQIVSIKTILKSSFKYIIAGLIMLIAVRIFAINVQATMSNTLLAIILGGITYIGVLFISKDELLLLLIHKIKPK